MPEQTRRKDSDDRIDLASHGLARGPGAALVAEPLAQERDQVHKGVVVRRGELQYRAERSRKERKRKAGRKEGSKSGACWGGGGELRRVSASAQVCCCSWTAGQADGGGLDTIRSLSQHATCCKLVSNTSASPRDRDGLPCCPSRTPQKTSLLTMPPAAATPL